MHSYFLQFFSKNSNPFLKFSMLKTTPVQAEPISTLVQVEPKSATASVYTFGFGSDHNAEMLKEISDAGGGMYYFIENTDKVKYFFMNFLL